MLCILVADIKVTRHGEAVHGGITEHQWHVGEEVPCVPVERIREVRASRAELNFVTDLFTFEGVCTIPRPRKELVSVRWCGNVARIIYLNL